MTYRPAIDGLRAIAVIAVLLFHSKIAGVSGGYVGVDVFFVISGFLITTLICRERIAGTFTLAGFYERRIRRILPAFFLVVLSTLAVGVVVLLPSDLERLGSSVVAACLFVSNFYFWREGEDYLQGWIEFLPLLHTWSLAIEEQFYVIFPVITLLILRCFKNRVSVAFLGLALCSFAFSIYLTWEHPRAAFYFSPARAWELLLGAWIAVVGVKGRVHPKLRPILQAAGLVMILYAALRYDVLTPFPGFAALVPCLGAGLIVAWSDDETPVTGVLSHPALVWFGLISYPLYLWHWPMLVLAKLALLRGLHGYEIVLIYGLAIVLAAASWRYVERPFRSRKGSLSAQTVFASAAAATCLAIAVGATLSARGGLLGTPPPEVARIMAAAKDYPPGRSSCHNWDRKNDKQLPDCIIGEKARPDFDFALWGDSHAGVLAKAVGQAAQAAGKKGLQLTADNCPPLLGTVVIIDRAVTDCDARNDIALDLLRKHHIQRVILAGQWLQYTGLDETKAVRPRVEPHTGEDEAGLFHRALGETVRRLRDEGIDVTIIGPVPYIGWNVPAVLASRKWRHVAAPEGPSLADFMVSQHDVVPFIQGLEKEGVSVVYPHEQLCKPTCLLELDGEILYSDGEHLTTRGADLLRPMFEQRLFQDRQTN